MKKTPSAPPFPRLLYALLLVVAAGLLWLLAQPKPGVRIVRLSPALAPDTGTPTPVVPDRIRIASYNIEHFNDARGDGPDRTPELLVAQARGAAEIIAEVNPDILLLQEVENARVLLFLNDQFEQPYDYIYVTDLRRSSGARDKLNLGVLSRLKPSRVRELGFQALSGPGRPTRGVLSVAFDLDPDTSLLAYNVHLKSNFGFAPRNHAQRGIALHLIGADFFSEVYRHHPRATLTLVVGDMNVDPDNEAFADDPSLEPLAGSFVDLWRGRPIEERTTIPTRHAGEGGDPLLVFPPAAFDRILASRNLRADGSWRIEDPVSVQKGTATHDNRIKPGVNGHVSDHYLVYVDLHRQPAAERRPRPVWSAGFDEETAGD